MSGSEVLVPLAADIHRARRAAQEAMAKHVPTGLEQQVITDLAPHLIHGGSHEHSPVLTALARLFPQRDRFDHGRGWLIETRSHLYEVESTRRRRDTMSFLLCAAPRQLFHAWCSHLAKKPRPGPSGTVLGGRR
jgi:hypothetical protein